MKRQAMFTFCFIFVLTVSQSTGKKEFKENSHHGQQLNQKYGPGPLVEQTNGQIWPKPQVQAQQDGTFHTFDVENFSFEVSPNFKDFFTFIINLPVEDCKSC